ncbi:MAG: aminopeptidase, partial [Flavobacterium sp.]|nr:aminopeptidase [Flavobacterium sp.]
MKKIYSFLLIAVLISGCSTTKDIYTSSDITVEELKQHVIYLASDELEGRKSGSKGNGLAARYIADQFKSYGLLPAGDNQTYFQNFTFVSDLKMGNNNLLAISIGEKKFLLEPDVDYRPMAFSSDTSISGSLTFVGYGISADTLHYNDYANIDVNGKVVIILRYSPDGKDQASPFSEYTAVRKKIMIARDKGALGVIFVNGPVDTTKDLLQPLQQERGFGNAGIAAIQMKQDAAQLIFEAAGKDLKTVQSEIDKDKKTQSFDFANTSVQLRTNIEKIYSNTANVIGYLPGSKLKEENIVIGAHFDHLGLGGQGSGSLLSETTAVHNGADDN